MGAKKFMLKKFRGSAKGWFWRMFPGTKTGTRVHSDVPPERKPERGYVRMFPRNEKPERGYVRQTTLFLEVSNRRWRFATIRIAIRPQRFILRIATPKFVRTAVMSLHLFFISQALLQGVPFMGAQVLRWKRLILLHEKMGPENRKNGVKLRPPLCRPLKHPMNFCFFFKSRDSIR